MSGTRKKIDEFTKLRAHARETYETVLVKEAQEVKKLDEHLQSFLHELTFDKGREDKETLHKHVKEFDALMHDEIDYLFKITEQDINLYLKVLQSLSSYRRELKKLLEHDQYKSLAEEELNYAALLHKTAVEKLETLQLLFKKLKQ